MKSTESLDDAGKSMGLSSAVGETAVPSDNSSIENKRRRLVRGAVAFAPLVLTLRSGALAAASCTGVKIVGVDVKNGTPRAGELLNPTKPIVAGDVCVESGLTQCGTDLNRVETLSNLNTINSEPVKLQGISPNTYWTCGNSEFQGKKVAILSSQSVTSMGVTG